MNQKKTGRAVGNGAPGRRTIAPQRRPVCNTSPAGKPSIIGMVKKLSRHRAAVRAHADRIALDWSPPDRRETPTRRETCTDRPRGGRGVYGLGKKRLTKNWGGGR